MPATRLLALSLLVLASCSVASDHLICEVKTTSGEYSKCLEWDNVAVPYRTTIETFFRAAGHQFGTGACPAGKLAGCKGMITSDGSGVAWYYPTTETASVQAVDKDCSADSMLVDANGNTLARGAPICSNITSPSPLVLTFRNSTAATVSLYVRDAACAETYRISLAAAAMQGQTTKAGEVWVARKGDMDPNGATVLVMVAQSSMLVDIK